MVTCAVPGCEDRSSTRHRFPNPLKDKKRFDIWVVLVANPKLVAMDPMKVYSNYRVCHQHFTPNDKSTNMYVLRTTVPSQKLPFKEATNPSTSTSTCTASEPLNVISTHSEEVSSLDTQHCVIPTSNRTTDPSTSTSTCTASDPSTSTSTCTASDPSTSTSTCTASEPLNVISTHSEGASSLDTQRSVTPTSRKRHSNTILKDLGVTKSSDLTPKAKKLYKRTRNLKSTVLLYKRRAATLKDRLKLAKNMFDTSANGLRGEAVRFCIQQLSKKTVKSKGRRYSLEEKLMCLGLYKISGSAYRFLARWFHLPSKRTILRILQKIPIKAGINKFLMQNLKAYVDKMKPNDKLCSVIFDEMALLPHVEYDKFQDDITGIENREIVDHVLVFMVKGVLKPWKQTISFQFCKSATKALELKTLINHTVEELNAIGLNVIALICDQGPTNRSAIKSLIADAREHYLRNNMEPRRRIIINNTEIIQLYDVPHLLKGIRNNLLNKNLVWQENELIVAKWKDIETAYEIDKGYVHSRAIRHITEQHVKINKIKKMKVCYAAQVFSHSMCSAISSMARNNETDATGIFTMRREASGTSKICKFFDTLFDSLNVSSRGIVREKEYTDCIRPDSAHRSLWQKAIRSLEKMYFQKEGTIEKIRPPSLKNFITTIQGFIDLNDLLFERNVPYYCSRMLNQDCIENFFGQIRQHRGRHNILTAKHFIQSYKTIMIRNITFHSVMANCEETGDTTLIQMRDLIHKIILEDHHDSNVILYESIETHQRIPKILNHDINVPGKQRLMEFLDKIIYKIKCPFCKLHIETGDVNNRYKSYFISCVLKIYNICRFMITNYRFTTHLKQIISIYTKQYVAFSFICEDKEATIKYLTDNIIDFYISRYCKYINNVLQGKVLVDNTTKSQILQQAARLHNKKSN